MARSLAQSLQAVLDREAAALAAISDSQALEASQPGGWSKKQELGHLIDSATNNHVRFVRAAIEPRFEGPGYRQDEWVRLHNYNALPWDTLLAFWRSYNQLLVHLVSQIREDRLQTEFVIDGYVPVTLGFIIEDYVLHMQHHLDHILGRGKLTPYPGLTLAKQALP
jgi:DinB superfamily